MTASCAVSAGRTAATRSRASGVRITAEDIMRAADSAEMVGEPPLPVSTLIGTVVRPALAEAESAFSAALARINVEDMVKAAEALK